MHNLSDQDLDHLSKEAAENYEAAASVGLWEKIQKRLDIEMPEAKKDKRRFFWLFGFAGTALLIALALGISVLKRHDTTTEILKTSNLIPKKTPREEPNARNKKNNDVNSIVSVKPDQEDRKTDLVDLTEAQSTTIEKTTEFPVEKNKTQKSTQDKKTDNTGLRIPASSKIQTPDQDKKNEFINNQFLLNPAGQTSNLPVTENEKQKNSDPLTDLSKKENLTVTAATDTDNDLKKMTDLPELSSKTTTKTKHHSQNKKSWEFAAVLGPDFSNVEFADPDKTGINVGILVSYRFTDRLSVQTGLLYSEKHYTSVGKEYTSYPGYNMANPNLKMQKVQANCIMWDMPVNLRYDWLLRKKSRAFVTTGLSSYFMNKEDLHYSYTYTNYTRYKSLVNEKNSSFWMAALNVSVGYEQLISSEFSLQAEPFFKIPTSQIGYGNIHLNSLGMFLSVKYSPSGKTHKNTKIK